MPQVRRNRRVALNDHTKNTLDFGDPGVIRNGLSAAAPTQMRAATLIHVWSERYHVDDHRHKDGYAGKAAIAQRSDSMLKFAEARHQICGHQFGASALRERCGLRCEPNHSCRASLADVHTKKTSKAHASRNSSRDTFS